MAEFENRGPDDVAEDLRAAFAEHEEPNTDDAPEGAQASQESDDPSGTQDTPESDDANTGQEGDERGGDKYWRDQERGPDGKFVSKEKTGEPGSSEAEQQDAPVGVQGQEGDAGTGEAEGAASEDEPTLGPNEPPVHWSLEEQELFRKQPEEVQKIWADRDAKLTTAWNQKTNALAQERQAIAPLTQLMGEEQTIQDAAWARMDVPNYLRHLTNLAHHANVDPAGFIVAMAKDNNIDLVQLGGGASAPPSPKPNGEQGNESDDIFDFEDGANNQGTTVDPTVAALQNTIRELTTEVASLKTANTERQQVDQTADRQRASEAVEAFIAETDESGNAKHPYFDEVADDIADLMNRGVVERGDLATAYDKAIWLNPTVRAKVQAAERAAADRARQEERRNKAIEAERAAESLTGSPAGAQEAEPALTVRDEVARAFHATS